MSLFALFKRRPDPQREPPAANDDTFWPEPIYYRATKPVRPGFEVIVDRGRAKYRLESKARIEFVLVALPSSSRPWCELPEAFFRRLTAGGYKIDRSR